MKRSFLFLASGALIAISGCGGGGAAQALAPKVANAAARWNDNALQAVRLDATAPVAGENRRSFKEEAGPVKCSRALAIVHVAMYDAVNSISKRYKTIIAIPDQPSGADQDAAASQAAHDALVAMYPSQSSSFDAELAADLVRIPDSTAKSQGVAAGKLAAQLLLNDRQNDGSAQSELGYTPSGLYLQWAPDPLNPGQKALGPAWGSVRPMVIKAGNQFRCPTPPATGSAEFKAACQQMEDIGGDGTTTVTKRTQEQTQIALFWGYDGSSQIGVPPRLYNQIVRTVADDRNYDLSDYSRLLAAVNVSMFDAGIACWESKYYYNYARPVTALRGAVAPDLVDANFTPFGAQPSNTNGKPFTPPFPSYPSGHATFGAAAFDTLGSILGTKNVSFSFVSDELNGKTTDRNGQPRPYAPRSFANLDAAEQENAQSRLYMGIHWNFDATEGIKMGQKVAAYVMQNAFQRRQ